MGENYKHNKGKGPFDPPKKKCFKCQGLGHFQVECRNRRVMTLKKVEVVNVVEDEGDELPIYDEECYLEEMFNLIKENFWWYEGLSKKKRWILMTNKESKYSIQDARLMGKHVA